ncbi:hypothetical protein JCM33374_g3722 [Metschnikowia sp. JCM 33374]|nr:hypothetical protein JCM33374_g3722 [Metschnikowia sp. JCM 33374]
MPRLEEWEIKKYWKIFQGLAPRDNKLTAEKVTPVLKNSRLKDDQLAQVWQAADIDADGQLDFEEFCITMRLIFDLVNGDIQSVPDQLPSWLVPSSKAHLIQANRAVASGQNSAVELASDDDEDTLSDDFDWYISPTDRATYEAIYNSSSDTYGRVKFEALRGLYDTLKRVPNLDISSAWNLVNPKSFETIDKDQVLVLLHMLNQRENGKRMPRTVPASLRATFSKEVPNYDLSQPQASPRTATEPSANDKKSFGTNYLTKIGQSQQPSRGTDFSTTEGTDWEEVRLRRELADLEKLLEKAQQVSAGPTTTSDSSLVKHEFDQLLKYKSEALATAKQLPNSDKNIADVRNDVNLIASQVKMLEEFLGEKEKELNGLRNQLGAV